MKLSVGFEMKCMRERKDLFRDRAWMAAVAGQMVAERQRGGLVEAGGE